VLSKLAEVGKRPTQVEAELEERGLFGTALRVVPLDLDAARVAAELRPPTKRHGLSLGDRACLALGRMTSGTVLTTDRVWKKLRLAGIEIEVVR
jgi:PIN domain nuclease of toxin-antitoxin system